MRSELICALTNGVPLNFLVEHVGATAVPGLAVKPTLGIDAPILLTTLLKRLLVSKESATYAAKTRECHFVNYSALPTTASRHTYVVADTPIAWQNHLAMRDASSTRLLPRYAWVKSDLVGQDIGATK